MERVLGHKLVFIHLPEYYWRPQEAKAYAQIITNLRFELRDVKDVHSAEKLAYKGALLNAVVGGGIPLGQLSVCSRMLSTNPKNLTQASLRRQSLESKGTSVWKSRVRGKKSDTLSKEVCNRVRIDIAAHITYFFFLLYLTLLQMVLIPCECLDLGNRLVDLPNQGES